MPDPEPCLCGDRSCPACYPRSRIPRELEPEDEDEFGRIEPEE